jgi:hypothetical protein
VKRIEDAGAAYTDVAIDQAARAVGELLAQKDGERR